MIDGTLEPGTPVFFGVQEARSAILLGCRKMPTENADDIAPCLQEIAHRYGVPRRILHDLSSAISRACHTALPQVPQQVCHFHCARPCGWRPKATVPGLTGTIVLTHVEKYLPYLLPANASGRRDGVRTTNEPEGYWSESRRCCRHIQGRRKLTRSFEALPAELMLIPNLRNAEYVQIVLDGSLDHLAGKFAEAQSQSRSYTTWRTTNRSLNLGRLPARVLRQACFVEHLIDIYDGQCQVKHRESA